MSLLEMRMRPPTEGALCLTSNKMAVGMRKCDAGRILRLFNWTEIDEALLTQLPYKSEGGGSLASKTCVLSMLELFFAAALEPSKNITNNPTCEWQLRLYYKRNNQDIYYMMYSD
jgi:hypothetical protein